MSIRTQNTAIATVFFALIVGLGVAFAHAAQQVISLHEAVEGGDVAAVRPFLAHGASFNVSPHGNGTKLIKSAIENGQGSMAQLLVEYGAGCTGMFAHLHAACRPSYGLLGKDKPTIVDDVRRETEWTYKARLRAIKVWRDQLYHILPVDVVNSCILRLALSPEQHQDLNDPHL